MADKKISELNAITGANTADDDLFVIVDTSTNETKKIAKSELVSTVNAALIDGAPETLDTLNELAAALADDANFATTVTNSLSGKVDTTGDSMTGNLSFGDNDKAVFGAGSDLQIYHDGSNSYIDDAGVGDLVIRGSSAIYLQKYVGENMLKATADAGVQLFHNNAEKLATTSTGVDVTGTATMDGLTVDSGTANTVATFSSTDIGANLTLSDSFQTGQLSSTGAVFSIDADPSNLYASTKLRLSTDGTKRVDIDGNGDISFYEDTGTTPKFFWDASAESLGIGTSSPSSILHLNSAYPKITINDTQGVNRAFSVGTNNETFTVRNETGGGDAFVINNINNVGIGTSSPSANLHISSSGDTVLRVTSADGNGAFLDLGDASDPDGGRIVYDSGSNLAFNTASTERMRIDSSGNLLVGGTSNPWQAGLMVSKNGQCANFNTSSGTVASVVEINTNANNTTQKALMVYDQIANKQVMRVYSNGSIWTDGGIYLGGTGSANHLDDYEQGNWTPIVQGTTTVGTGTYSVQAGGYTKIGNTVHFSLRLVVTNHTGAGNFRVDGLPFSEAEPSTYGITGDVWLSSSTTAGTPIGAFVSGTQIIPYENATSSPSQIPIDPTFTLYAAGTYKTAS